MSSLLRLGRQCVPLILHGMLPKNNSPLDFRYGSCIMVYMMTNKDLISLLLTGTMLFSFSLVIYFVVAVA